VQRVPAGVAGHHPDIPGVGLEILAEGGTAADAAVAATLATCVAETTMTGLAGGGHGIHFEAATGRVDIVDFFVAVPGLDGGLHHHDPVMVDMLFEDEAVPYAIGPGSVGVPGVVAGCGALAGRFGRLPWPRLVEPALRLAREDCILPPTHARVLEMLAPAMTRNEGADVFAPGGALLQGGDTLHQPDLVHALEVIAAEGPSSFTTGTIAESIVELMRERSGPVSAADLAGYEVLWLQPQTVTFSGATVHGRRDLAGALDTLAALPDLRGRSEGERAVSLARALGGRSRGDTTNVTVVDADGNACVMTTSLGLGSSDWLPGLGIHLNSMLGEQDLIVGPLVPGRRLGSMMCPIVGVDGEGLAVAAGAAGGSRIRSALLQVLSGVIAEELDVVDAVERPRLHPDGALVHIEPGFPAGAAAQLREAGFITRQWRTRHHYFGGVSVVARRGACGEPRRDGAAAVLG
jgi:gamma-glutamyltranspeptidase / glutathione hydrolase